MSKILPGVYDTNGNPAVVDGDWEVLRPQYEGRAQPTPAAGAASALGFIPKIIPQAGLTETGTVQPA